MVSEAGFVAILLAGMVVAASCDCSSLSTENVTVPASVDTITIHNPTGSIHISEMFMSEQMIISLAIPTSAQRLNTKMENNSSMTLQADPGPGLLDGATAQMLHWGALATCAAASFIREGGTAPTVLVAAGLSMAIGFASAQEACNPVSDLTVVMPMDSVHYWERDEQSSSQHSVVLRRTIVTSTSTTTTETTTTLAAVWAASIAGQGSWVGQPKTKYEGGSCNDQLVYSAYNFLHNCINTPHDAHRSTDSTAWLGNNCGPAIAAPLSTCVDVEWFTLDLGSEQMVQAISISPQWNYDESYKSSKYELLISSVAPGPQGPYNVNHNNPAFTETSAGFEKVVENVCDNCTREFVHTVERKARYIMFHSIESCATCYSSGVEYMNVHVR